MTEVFIHELDVLKRKLLSLSAAVEDALTNALRAFELRDTELANEVMAGDEEIDRMEIEVEDLCLRTLALYQPVASDFRFLVGSLKVNEALERIGDLAANISRRSTVLNRYPKFDLADETVKMGFLAQEMVKHSIDALVKNDGDLCREIRAQDDVLDAMRDDLNARILEHIRNGPEDLEGWMALFSVVRHMERLGDMAVVIAEDVIYIIEAEVLRHNGVTTKE